MPFKFKRSKNHKSFSDRLLAPIRSHPKYRKYAGKLKNFEEAVFVCLVAFSVGLFAGILAGHSWSVKPGGAADLGGGPGLFQKMFGQVMSVPGAQPDGSFVFSGFETVSDFKAWTLDAADMEMSPAHPSEGEHSAKVHLYGRTTLAGIRMEEYFDSRYALTDWSGFRAFRAFLYNSEDKPVKIIFQLKDAKGKRFKQELLIAPDQGVDFEIPLAEAAKEINLKKIRQVNFFIWKGSNDHEFYFDNVRVVT